MERFLLLGAVMQKRRVRVRENSWLAKRAAKNLKFDYVAMVLGHTIHLHNTTKERFFARPSWVCHELMHVVQYERYGMLGFLFRYFREHLRRGYWNNTLEVEARAAEADQSLLERYDLSEYAGFMVGFAAKETAQLPPAT